MKKLLSLSINGKKIFSGWEKNWKSIAKIVAAAVVITGLGIAAALTGGILGVILAGAFWGALAGGLIGGAVGGIAAAINGGSFLEGFADGALSGRSGMCRAWCFRSSSREKHPMYELGMDGFDMLAMGISLFDPSKHWLNLTGSCIPMHFITDSRLL